MTPTLRPRAGGNPAPKLSGEYFSDAPRKHGLELFREACGVTAVVVRHRDGWDEAIVAVGRREQPSGGCT